jgi:sensor histidine kinase YesM
VIQSSDDDQVASFFDEVRTTSYYLTDNFESFLDYFLKSLARESELIQRRMIVTFIAVTAVAGLFTISVSLYFARRITESIKGVERTIRQVSLGDFSTHVNLASNDEFGTLSAKLNSFIDDLKSNVDSIINLMRDVGTGTGERLGLDGIFALVVESVVKDMRIGGAAIFLSEELGAVMRLRASAGAFPLSAQAAATSTVSSSDAVFGAAFRSGLPIFLRDVEAGAESCGSVVDASQARSVIAIPLVVSKRVIGVLAAATARSDRQLNDLDRTNLSTFADYTALTIDNFTQYTELIERREAEYQALQSQVHPHFLYNVLAGFVGLNRLGDRKTLERSILALKEMLRYTIEHQEWTTVEEEFQFIRRYCDLQKLRFRERLDFTLSYDEDAAPCHIPKLLLQPLVENAVIHGIEPLDRTGHLQVHAGLKSSDFGRILCLTVSDDGVGFEPGPIGKQAHIGLYNVKERVALAFEKGAFRIASRPGEGTQIEILTSAMEP